MFSATSRRSSAALLRRSFATLKIANPYDGAVLAELPLDTQATIHAKATKAATSGARQLQAAPLGARIAAALRFGELLKRDAEVLAQQLTAEMGKPIAQARNEVNATPAKTVYWAQHIASVLDSEVCAREPGRGGAQLRG